MRDADVAPCRCRITKAYQGRRLVDDGEVPLAILLDDGGVHGLPLGRKGEAAEHRGKAAGGCECGPNGGRIGAGGAADGVREDADGGVALSGEEVGRVAVRVGEGVDEAPRGIRGLATDSKRRRRRLRLTAPPDSWTMSSVLKLFPPMTVWSNPAARMAFTISADFVTSGVTRKASTVAGSTVARAVAMGVLATSISVLTVAPTVVTPLRIASADEREKASPLSRMRTARLTGCCFAT